MELIIMDEQGAKMHATVRMSLVPMFKQQLNEGDAVMLQFCMLWGDCADQFTEFLKSCDDVRLIIVIQLGKMKNWDGVMLFGTKLFMHKTECSGDRIGHRHVIDNSAFSILDHTVTKHM
ncbi:replication protein A 70 kDa DNA-binding subunit B [Tanacetum coccineum]